MPPPTPVRFSSKRPARSGVLALALAAAGCSAPQAPSPDSQASTERQVGGSLFTPVGSIEAPTDFSSVDRCDVVQIDPAIREDRTKVTVRTVQDFTREIVYSAYPWRTADGASIKIYRATPPGTPVRPQYWFVIAGSIPSFWDNNVNDNNENLLTQDINLASQSAYMLMVARALEHAVSSGTIPEHSQIFFTGHSQGSNIASLVPLLLGGDLLAPESGVFQGLPAEIADRGPFLAAAAMLRQRDVTVGGGLGVAGRPMPLWSFANLAAASNYGHQFTWVSFEGDPVPFLGTSLFQYFWNWKPDPIGKVMALAGFTDDAVQSLFALAHLGANTPLVDLSLVKAQSALWGVDRAGRSPADVHGQGFLDPRNSLAAMKYGNMAPPVCQDDVVFVPNDIGEFEVDFVRNDFQTRPARSLSTPPVGPANVVEASSPDLPAAFSQNGSRLHVRLPKPPPVGAYARLRYAFREKSSTALKAFEHAAQCSVHVEFRAPGDPQLSPLTSRQGWKTVVPAFNTAWRAADSVRFVTAPDCPGCELPRADVVYPADAPFVAYAPGFSHPWAEGLRANDFPAVGFELVDLYGYDCFSHIAVGKAHQVADINANPGPPIEADVCLPSTGLEVRLKGDRKLLRMLDPATQEPIPGVHNQQPDHVPDMLWVSPARWGTSEAAEDAERVRDDWKVLENAINLWVAEGAVEEKNPYNLLFVARNRNLVGCLDAPTCPDGEPASVLHPDDDACPAPGALEYLTGVGNEVLVPALTGLDTDDDWYLNAWVAAGPSDGSTVRLQEPAKKMSPPGAPFPHWTYDPHDLRWVAAAIDPRPTFELVRPPGAPKPMLSFTPKSKGKYTLNYTLRNSRGGRRVGTITVRAGRWHGLWETFTRSGTTFTHGGWCRPPTPGEGSDWYGEHYGHNVLDLGTGGGPLPVVGGFSDKRDLTCGAPANVLIPGTIGGQASGVPMLSSISTSSGAHGGRNVNVSTGRLVCTGLDDGTPESGWAACAAQKGQAPPGVSKCIPDACSVLQ